MGGIALNVLFLTNLPPYPLDNGGKIKTHCALSALRSSGHAVTLVGFCEESEKDLQYGGASVKKIPEEALFVRQRLTSANNVAYMLGVACKSLVSDLPFGVLKYRSRRMYDLLARTVASKHFDLIYIDHVQMGLYLRYLRKCECDAPCVLDAHNCESSIVMQKGLHRKNPFTRWFFLNEYSKFARFEGSIAGEADAVIALSDVDKASLQELAPTQHSIEIIPIGVPDRGVGKVRCKTTGSLKLLFLGTLSWEPNHEGLMWFLDEVYPRLDGVELVVAGRGAKEALRRKLEALGVDFRGCVESVDPLYDECDVVVAPLLTGSGQRVKIIEAFSKGMPVVSTRIGAEGIACTPGEDILIADDPEEFVSCIQGLLDGDARRRLAEHAREVYCGRYSLESVGCEIARVVESVISR